MKMPQFIIVAIVFFLLSIIHLTFNAQNMRANYDVENLKLKRNELYSKNRLLSTKAAQKSSLSRVEKIAREKLKMVYPEEMHYIIKKTAEASPKPDQ